MSTLVLSPPGEATMGRTSQPDHESRATKYWAQHIRSVAGPLLKLTGSYPPHDQEAHLEFLDSHVAPVLGPMPTEPHGVYTMPYAGSPVEFTVTSTSGGRPKAHIQFESERPLDRAGDDPFGQANGREVLRRVASAVGADTTWMESLISSLHLTPAETELARSIVPSFVPAGFVGIAFEGARKVMKAYFVPALKALARQRTPSAVALDAVRKLQPLQDGLAPGADLLEEYLNSGSNNAQVALVAIDCIDPKDARVKIYLVVQSNSWDTVSDVLTLGGRLDDEQTLESLKTLRSIYPLLRDEAGPAEAQRDDAWSKPDRIPGTQFSGLHITVELSPGREVPEIKVYVPTFQYAPSTEVALSNYQKVLEKLGLDWGRDGKFEESIRTMFGDKTIGGMGYVSYAYSKKKGVYTSFYLAAPTDNEAQEWQQLPFDLWDAKTCL